MHGNYAYYCTTFKQIAQIFSLIAELISIVLRFLEFIANGSILLFVGVEKLERSSLNSSYDSNYNDYDEEIDFEKELNNFLSLFIQ